MNVNVATADWTTTALADAPFEVKRLGRHLGAEITGLDLTKSLDDRTFRALEAALIQNKVIFLRDQNLTTRQHVELSRWFGELEVHPFRPEGEFPEIMVLDNHKDNPVLSTDVWHSDTTFRVKPTKYTILRCQIMPPLGGDTLWCDMEAAYNGLSEKFRTMIGSLQARHDFKNFRALFTRSEADQKKLQRMEDLYPNPLHPVVRTHPVTGRKCIYVNPQFTLHIDDMNEDESSAILDVLFAQTHVPEYQFRFQWSPGAIIFWDNQSTQHYAANDYYPERRRMERTAVCGDAPF
jgi:taurine dioxygenase